MFKLARRLLIWLIFAILLCYPTSLKLQTYLLGDPSIDVWNHAWGYWYVYNQLMTGQFVDFLHTRLVGAPEGGSLYFIDTPGAIVALPITAFFGPAAAYNSILLLRIAGAALAAQLLYEELAGPRAISGAGWFAGAAYASSPFLLCELSNGISEVCAIQWIAFTFWATARALRRDRWRDWLLLGFFQAATTITTFYYGLAAAIILLPLFIGHFLRRLVQQNAFSLGLAKACTASIFSLLLIAPHGLAFWRSIHRDDRLVLRDISLNAQLLRHNAVDPAIYVTPGHYQSVDLLNEYGEPFLHTGYLRWSIICLALIALWYRPRLRPWGLIGLFSAVLGMGSFLWWQGDWWSINGQYLSLPFDWLRQALPQIAITHPLRLSIAAQLMFCVLAASGFTQLTSRLGSRLPTWSLGLFILCFLGESTLGSSATWPIPSSSATIPSLYANTDNRGVLDLPAEIGTSMKTSRYFWLQTEHESPIPYTPDVRIGSARDRQTFEFFIGSDGVSEDPRTPPARIEKHIRKHYGLIVLHHDLAPTISQKYIAALKPILGEPQQSGGLYFWQLEPYVAALPPTTQVAQPKPNEQATNAPNCGAPAKELAELPKTQGQQRQNAENSLMNCRTELSKTCYNWLRRADISLAEINICLQSFEKHPISNINDVLIQLLRHSEPAVRSQTLDVLAKQTVTTEQRSKLQRFLREEQVPTVKTKLQQVIAP